SKWSGDPRVITRSPSPARTQVSATSSHAIGLTPNSTKSLSLSDARAGTWASPASVDTWRSGSLTFFFSEDLLFFFGQPPLVVAFELLRGAVAEGRVQPCPVVEHLDVVEHGRPRLLPGAERAPAEQLLLERGVVALD